MTSRDDADSESTSDVATDPAAGDAVEIPASDPPASEKRPRRARMIAAAVMGLVAILLLHATLLGAWTMRTALDSERFADQIQRLLQTEEVSSSLSEFVLDEVGAAVDLRTPLEEITPDAIEPLIDVLLAGIESRLQDLVAEVIRSDEVSGAVAATAGQAHALAIDVLEGESVVDGVRIEEGGVVRINLLPLVGRALTLVQEFGVLSDVDVPELEAGGDPADQVEALEEALGVDLPDDFAQPQVFQSDTLEEAGTAVDLARSVLLFARRVLWIFLILGAALAAGSIWFARRRLRAAGLLVGGVAVLSALTWASVRTVAEEIPEAVTSPGAQATVRQVVRGLEDSLNRTLFWYLLLTGGALALALYVRMRWPDAFSREGTTDANDEPDGDGDGDADAVPDGLG